MLHFVWYLEGYIFFLLAGLKIQVKFNLICWKIIFKCTQENSSTSEYVRLFGRYCFFSLNVAIERKKKKGISKAENAYSFQPCALSTVTCTINQLRKLGF